jgi:hypothetical protein
MKTFDSSSDSRRRATRTTRWFVIGFAVVEALIIGWVLLSYRWR